MDRQSLSRLLADKAVESLIREARLSPKPGLVDSRGNGCHTDMNLSLMEASANSLHSGFEEMARVCYGRSPSDSLRETIGAIGRMAEEHMLSVTGGINTHRGAIWSLGLLVSSYSTLKGCADSQLILNRAGEIARIPDRAAPKIDSHGLKAQKKFKVPGAREEAQWEFPHIKYLSLPVLDKSRAEGLSLTSSLLNALLAIMTHLPDTCVLHRGGMEALKMMHLSSFEVLLAGGFSTKEGRKLFDVLDTRMREKRLSPGGAADLLGATLFVNTLTD